MERSGYPQLLQAGSQDTHCRWRSPASGLCPVGVRSAAEIEKLRQQANWRFLSASYPGVYRQVQQDVPSKGRKLDVA